MPTLKCKWCIYIFRHFLGDRNAKKKMFENHQFMIYALYFFSIPLFQPQSSSVTENYIIDHIGLVPFRITFTELSFKCYFLGFYGQSLRKGNVFEILIIVAMLSAFNFFLDLLSGHLLFSSLIGNFLLSDHYIYIISFHPGPQKVQIHIRCQVLESISLNLFKKIFVFSLALIFYF